MTTLMRDQEIDRNVAARKIATRLNEMGYGDEKLSAGQVAKWREKMMTESAAENLAVQRYQLSLELVKTTEPAAAVKFLLDNLPILHPAHFPKRRPSRA
jgi:beta-lactamase class D